MHVRCRTSKTLRLTSTNIQYVLFALVLNVIFSSNFIQSSSCLNLVRIPLLVHTHIAHSPHYQCSIPLLTLTAFVPHNESPSSFDAGTTAATSSSTVTPTSTSTFICLCLCSLSSTSTSTSSTRAARPSNQTPTERGRQCGEWSSQHTISNCSSQCSRCITLTIRTRS